MATLGFPSNPNTGTQYTIGTRTWVWTGQGWKIDSGSTTLNNLNVSQITVTTSTNAIGTNSGGLIVYGGASIGKDLYVGGKIVAQELDIQLTTVTTTLIETDDIVRTLNTSNAVDYTSGALQIAGGASIGKDLYVGNYIHVGGIFIPPNTTTNSTIYTPVDIRNETSSTSRITGALTVLGGVGISGDLHVGNIISNGLKVLTSNDGNTGFVSRINAGEDISVSTNTGIVTVNDISTLQSVTNRGNSTTNKLYITNDTESTFSDTGALQVSGGIGVLKNIYAGGTVFADTLNVRSNSSITGILTVGSVIVNSYDNAYSSTNSGALQVLGGIGVGGNIYAGGDMYARGYKVNTGTFTGGVLINNTKVVSSETSTSTNSGALQVVGGIGIGGDLYVGNSGSFDYITVRGTTTSTVAGELDVNTLIVKSSTISTGTDSGALQVIGGVGIGGNLYVGDTSYINGAQILTTATVNQFANQTTIYAGTDTAIESNGGVNTIWNISTLQTITDRGSSTNHAIIITDTSTGALQVSGGVGIGTDLNVIGTINGNNLQVTGFDYASTVSGYLDVGILKVIAPPINFFDASSTDTGAFQVLGGAGIGLNLWVGRNLHVAGTAYMNNAEILTTQSGFSSILGISVVNQTLQINTATNSTSTNSGALQVVGGVGIGGNLYVGGDVNVNGALVLTTSSIGNAAVTSIFAGTDTAVSANTGAVTIWNTSTLQTITDRGSSTTNAILITNTSTASSTDSGALIVAGGAGVGGDMYVGGNLYQQGSQVVTFANTASLISSAAQYSSTAGFALSFNTSTLVSVAITANSSTFATTSGYALNFNTGTLVNISVYASSSSYATTAGTADALGSGIYTITNVTPATSTNSGALQIVGGVGIGGDIYVGGSLYQNGQQILTTASVNQFANQTSIIAGTDTAISTSTGNITIWNTSNLQTITNRGNSTTNTIRVLNSLASTGSVVNNALYVEGGVGIGKSLFVTGEALFLNNVTFAGTTTYVLTTNTVYTDNIIQLHYPNTPGNTWTVDDGKDIGFRFHYYDGGDQNAGLVLSNEEKYLEWYSKGTEDSTSTFAGGTYGTFKTGSIILTNTTASNSTTTGALTVAGGVGIGGDVYISGLLYQNGQQVVTQNNVNQYANQTTITAGTDTAVSTSTGNIIIWNNSTLQTITNRGNSTNNTILVINATSATSTNSGALQVVGGVGLGGNLYVGKNANINGSLTLAPVVWSYLPTTFTNIPVTYGETRLTFTLEIDDAITNISVAHGAGGYGPGSVNLTIPGTTFPGGTSPANDIVFNVETFESPGPVYSTALSSAVSYVSGTLPPRYDSIKSTGNVGIGAENSHWTFGTDGVLTLPDAGPITSVSGGIDIYPSAGQSAIISNYSGYNQLSAGDSGVSIQTSPGNAGVAFNTWNFGTDGNLTVSGRIIINSTASSISTNTGALVVVGGVGIGGALHVATTSYINSSKILTEIDLQTVTHTATYITNNPGTVSGLLDLAGTTSTVYGTYNFGSVSDIWTFNDFNTGTNFGFYSINDASGAPGFIVYIGFSGITDFNRIVLNINYTQNSGHTQNIELYNYDQSQWDTFTTYSGSPGWFEFILGTIDSAPYISSGNVTARINHVSFGNTAHRTWIDYVALEKSIQGGQGPRGATGATGAQGIQGLTTTTTSTFIFANTTNSTSTNSGAVTVYGGVGIGGDLYVGRGITATIIKTTGDVNIGGNLSVGGTFTATAININGQAVGYGYAGSRGYDGSGIRGYDGSASTVSGPQGPMGYYGSQGNTGQPGQTGPQGPQGFAGSRGFDGSRGVTGFYGSTGYDGSMGSKGFTGSKGDDGQSVRIVGSTATASISNFNAVDPTPTIGDGVIVQSNGHLWTYTGATGGGAIAGFVDVGQLAGPTGNTGPQGPQGYWGSTGYAGSLGYAGSVGPQGPAGPTGPQGLMGYYGSQGNTGNPGQTGAQGPQGYSGSIGPSGPSGPTGYTGSSANPSGTTSTFIITNVTSATSTNSGALQVVGGAGIGGNLYVGGSIFNAAGQAIGSNSTGTTSTFTILNTTSSTSTNTGALQVRGGAGIGGDLWIGGNIYGAGGQLINATSTGTTSTFTILNTASSTSTTTGALVVRGGVGIGGDIYITGNIVDVKSGLAYGIQTTGTTSTFVISNGTNSTSTVTGALVVQGGVGIGQDVNIGGSVQIGSTATSGSISGVSSINAQNIIVTGSLTAPGLNFGTGTFTTPVVITNKTASTSTNSGALIVSGGAGIAGDVNVGQTLTVGTTATSGSITGVSSINAQNIIVTGSLTAPNLNINNSGTFTTPITVSTTTNATSTATGALIVSGGAGFGGTVYANSFVTDGGLGTISGVAYITTLYLTATNSISITGTTSATTTSTGALTVRGGVGVGGDLYIGGNIYGATGQSIVASSTGTTSTFTIRNTTASASTDTGALVVFGGVGVGGDLYIKGRIVDIASGLAYGVQTTGTTSTYIISNYTQSTGTLSGALIVGGGVGIGGNLYVGGALTATITTVTSLTVSNLTATRIPFVTTGGLLTDNANFYVDNANALIYAGGGGAYIGGTGGFGTVSATRGFINSADVLGFGAKLNVTGQSYLSGSLYVTGVSTLTNTVSATSTTTGALQVVGGAGIGGNLYVGNTLTVLSALASTSSVSGNALYVAGGVGIGGSLYVTGPAIFQNNVTFAGTSTYIYSTNTVYTDNLINLHVPSGSTGTNHTWTVDDGKDIGFIFHYFTSTDKDAFLGLASDSRYLEWYSNGTEVGGVFTGTTYGTFKTGSIVLVDATTATSTSSGSLTVRGGVGIGGDLWIGGTIYGASGQSINATSTGTTSTFFINNATASTGTNTGSLIVGGGAGIAGNLNVGGNIVGGGVRSSSTSTAPSNPTVGDIWYNTTTDDMYRYTSDGASSYWLDISGPVVTNVTAYNATPLLYRLDSDRIGNQTTSPQTVFGVGVTLTANTVYQFEAVYALNKSAGVVSHTVGYGFGGTATLNNIGYTRGWGFSGTAFNAPVSTAGNLQVSGYVQTASVTTLPSESTTSATAYWIVTIKGTVSVNAGGTFIPQYVLSAAPGGAYTTSAGSYIRLTPIGTAGSNVAIGLWS